MLQDLSILFLHYLGYSKLRKSLHRFLRMPLTRFIVFHDTPSWKMDNFRSNLQFLKHNMNVVSIDDFFAGKLSSKALNVVITFDDGYKSWVSVALPVLKELDIPATFFISSGFVGLSKGEEDEFLRLRLFRRLPPRLISGCLSHDDVKSIADHDFSIGGHTLTHCSLSEIRDIREIKHEIEEDKAKLEKITNKDIRFFSYPGGDYYNTEINITDILRDAGYLGAVTVQSGFNNQLSNPYLLHRDIMDAATPGPVFRAKVDGNYDLVNTVKKRIRSGIQQR